MSTSEQSPIFYLRFSPELSRAMDAVILHNAPDGKTNMFSRSNFIRDALKKFVTIAPYECDGFFWTKRDPMSKDPEASAKYGVGYEKDYAPLGELLERHALLNHQKIIMDHGEISLGKNLTKTIIGHTAIVWWMTTQLNDEEKALPEVGVFIDYAKHHYVDQKSGEVLIDRYQRYFEQYLELQADILAKEKEEHIQNDMFAFNLLDENDAGHTSNLNNSGEKVHLDFYGLSTQDMGDDMRVSFNIKKADIQKWVKRFVDFAKASDLHDFID